MTNVTTHVVGWLLLPAVAAVNGGLRDATYGRRMGRTAAHSLAVVPLLTAILGWAVVLQRRRPLAGRGPGVTVGLVWLLLTLAFEFGLGAARGVPRREMLAEYDVRRGHLWPLVPLTTACAPELARRWAGRSRRQDVLAARWRAV